MTTTGGSRESGSNPPTTRGRAWPPLLASGRERMATPVALGRHMKGPECPHLSFFQVLKHRGWFHSQVKISDGAREGVRKPLWAQGRRAAKTGSGRPRSKSLVARSHPRQHAMFPLRRAGGLGHPRRPEGGRGHPRWPVGGRAATPGGAREAHSEHPCSAQMGAWPAPGVPTSYIALRCNLQ